MGEKLENPKVLPEILPVLPKNILKILILSYRSTKQKNLPKLPETLDFPSFLGRFFFQI